MKKNSEIISRKRFETIYKNAKFINKMQEKEDNDLLSIFNKSLQSVQIEDDFEKAYTEGLAGKSGLSIIRPPYNKNALCRLVDESSALLPCIESIVVNVYGQPSRLIYAGKYGEDTSTDAVEERDYLQTLLDCPNEDYDLLTFKKRIGMDRLIFGEAYIEVARDSAGNIVSFYHVPAYSMRLTEREKTSVTIKTSVKRGDSYVTIVRKKNFRRYVQMLSNGKKRYFKEFGDPRTIDPDTGEYNKSLTPDKSTTEIIHYRRYHPKYLYGIPSWITQTLSILGSMKSEEVNYKFFDDNAIPAMAILVSGGTLSANALEEIQSKIEGDKGVGSMNKVLVLEALGDDNAASVDGRVPTPTVGIHPLLNSRQKDELFQGYNDNCASRVRSSFRLPSIIVGRSNELSYASANTSFQIADSQIFSPERQELEGLFNNVLFRPFKVMYWKFRSVPPRVVGTIDTIRSLRILSEIGAITPNVAIDFLNELFNINIPHYEQVWGNYPLQLSIALLNQRKNIKGLEELAMELESNQGSNTNEETVIDSGNEPKKTSLQLVKMLHKKARSM